MSYATIQQINSGIMFGNLTNEQLDSVVMAVKYARAQMAKENMRAIYPGDTVFYYSPKQGRDVQGRVIKLGRKFVTVQDSTNNSLWRVPANMLKTAA
jgi:predicted RNA-binding protein with PUA-like domain